MIASERSKDAWRGALRRSADRLLARYSSRIITNAEAVRQFLIQRIRLPPGKINVVPNGLDLLEFDMAASAGVSAAVPEAHGSPVIGMVGRLEPQKGARYLIEAFARLPADLCGTQLWIVGAGPEEAGLRQRAADARVQRRVHFLGARADVPALMTRFDLLVLPSLWEGLPNVALEAMAARRPVVATNVDGTPEAVADEQTGILVPPADPVALAQATERLLREAELRRSMGEAGRRRVETHFTMERMVQRTQDIYREVLAEARNGG